MNELSTAALIGEVVLPGLLIVFLALVILIFAIWVMGKIVGGRKTKPSSSGAPSPSSPAPSPVAQTGIPEEVVAAIAAAVTVTMEETAPGVRYAVTGIRRANVGRPAWGFAGMQQDTRPF